VLIRVPPVMFSTSFFPLPPSWLIIFFFLCSQSLFSSPLERLDRVQSPLSLGIVFFSPLSPLLRHTSVVFCPPFFSPAFPMPAALTTLRQSGFFYLGGFFYSTFSSFIISRYFVTLVSAPPSVQHLSFSWFCSEIKEPQQPSLHFLGPFSVSTTPRPFSSDHAGFFPTSS